MESYLHLSKKIAQEESSPVMHISQKGYKQMKEFNISCGTLEDLTNKAIQHEESFKEMFQEIMELKGPVLYIFEIMSNFDADFIIKKITDFRNSLNWKATPAIKRQIPDSNILYVGKVKKNFEGRVYQHLGYYKVQATQALQLFHWAKELKLELKLTAIEFEPDATEFLSILEKGFAKKLQPILGKHK